MLIARTRKHSSAAHRRYIVSLEARVAKNSMRVHWGNWVSARRGISRFVLKFMLLSWEICKKFRFFRVRGGIFLSSPFPRFFLLFFASLSVFLRAVCCFFLSLFLFLLALSASTICHFLRKRFDAFSTSNWKIPSLIGLMVCRYNRWLYVCTLHTLRWSALPSKWGHKSIIFHWEEKIAFFLREFPRDFYTFSPDFSLSANALFPLPSIGARLITFRSMHSIKTLQNARM